MGAFGWERGPTANQLEAPYLPQHYYCRAVSALVVSDSGMSLFGIMMAAQVNGILLPVLIFMVIIAADRAHHGQIAPTAI